MKKVLFATTALVGTAGVAAADVSLSGFAEMGIYGGSAIETQFHNDIDIKFTLSGTTDNGLTFGATIDLDEVTNAGDDNGIPAGRNDASVFISGDFGTLTMGDTDGAFDWALQEIGIGSALADDHTTHGGYSGNSQLDGNGAHDGQILRYDNTFGSFGVAISADLDDTGVLNPTWQLGLKYTAALGSVDLGFGLGYVDYETVAGSDSAWGLSVDANFAGGFRAILNYTDLGDTDAGGVGETYTGIGLGYSSGPITVAANYGEFEEGTTKQDGWGVVANYDLGGGAVAQFGYGDTGSCGVYAGCATNSTWSLGLALSF